MNVNIIKRLIYSVSAIVFVVSNLICAQQLEENNFLRKIFQPDQSFNSTTKDIKK